MPGANDANGVYNYAEDDNISLFSDLLNLGTESISTQLGLRPKPGTSGIPFRMAAGSLTVTGNATVTFPSGRFSVAPILSTGAYTNGANTAAAPMFLPSPTATSFTIYGETTAQTARTARIDWIAIQMTSTTAAG
jgi:hypothetical protein